MSRGSWIRLVVGIFFRLAAFPTARVSMSYRRERLANIFALNRAKNEVKTWKFVATLLAVTVLWDVTERVTVTDQEI